MYTKTNILIVLLVISLVGGIFQYSQKTTYKRDLDAQYQRMFYDLIDNVNNIQTDLAKISINTSSKENIVMLSNIMSIAYTAQSNMAQLPLNHVALGKTQKFLTQVGDYAATLAKETIDDKLINDKERKKLIEFQESSKYLSQQLLTLNEKLKKDKDNFFDIISKSNKELEKVNKNILGTNMIRIEERMSKIPQMIYDGPFSEHIGTLKPRLTGDKIDRNKAKEVALDFLKYKSKNDLLYDGRLKNATICGYVYKNNDVNIAISEIGARVIWMINSRTVVDSKLSKEDAINISNAFIVQNGYKNMMATYSLEYDNCLTINYAYKENDIVFYPDIIKVKVALDNGEIVSFDAHGYLVSHYNRKFEKPKVSIEKAKENIISGAIVSPPRLTVIPTEASAERLCYEFKVKDKDNDFLIYVDVNTGNTAKILQLIKNDKGTLTI